MEKVERYLKIATSAIATVIPSILLAGYSYHLGYITTFGLDEELIDKSMADMLVQSWYVSVVAIAWLLSKWPYLLWFFLFLVIVVLASFFAARYARQRGVSWLFEELTKHNQGIKILGITQWHWCRLGELFNEVSPWFLYLLLVVFLSGMLTIYPYQKGQFDAEKQLRKYAESGCQGKNRTVECIYLVDMSKAKNMIIAKGLFVTSNHNKIALYDNRLEVWPLLDRYVVRKYRAVGASASVSEQKADN